MKMVDCSGDSRIMWLFFWRIKKLITFEQDHATKVTNVQQTFAQAVSAAEAVQGSQMKQM